MEKKDKCEYTYDGKKCKKEALYWIRGMQVCRIHYNILCDDNKYRAAHDIEIPVKSSEITRKLAEVFKKANI